MKQREFIIANSIIVLLVIFFSVMTFNIFSNQNLKDLAKNTTDKLLNNVVLPETNVTTNCTTKAKLELSPEEDIHLSKLAEYQENCNSFATDRLMIFIDFPYDMASAEDKAVTVAQKLFLFSKNKVTPIVIVEPYVGDHSMQYRDYKNGKYDSALNYYFQVLKQQGVTDEMMGVWVPFPESNTPNWENKDTEPNDFAIVVNKYLSTMKAYFPKAHGSILLSAITYEPNDLDWENGDYISLTPYLANINKTLVDSLGIQGLPWMAPKSRNGVQIFRASEFLQPDIAISAAQELRTRDIWLNTGSFYTKYTNTPEEQVYASLNDRKGVLDGIIDVATYIKGYQLNEYRVRINLFSEDKSKTQESTDWSYFQNADSIDLLKDFLHKTEELEIPVSISDKVN